MLEVPNSSIFWKGDKNFATRSFQAIMSPGTGPCLADALGLKASVAQEKIPVGGEVVLAVVKYQQMNVRDTKGHALFLVEYQGNNASRGKQEFMNKSQVGMLLFGDLESRMARSRDTSNFEKRRIRSFPNGKAS